MRLLARRVQLAGAWMLVLGYMQDVFLTLQTMRLHQDAQGTWQVLMDAESVSKWGRWVAFALVLLGILAFMSGYVLRKLIGNWKQKREGRGRLRRPRLRVDSRLTMRDMVIALGWVTLFMFGGMLLYSVSFVHLLPLWFVKSPAASALLGVSMQIAAIVAIPYYYRRLRAEIGLQGPILSWRIAGYVAMFFVFMYALSLLTNSLGQWMGVDTNTYREQHITQEIQHALQGGWFVSLMPVMATSLIAPLGEELVFRGVLQSTFSARFGSVMGVLVSAFLFALVHADLVLFVPIFVIGVLFSLLYRVSGTIWAPVWLHVLNNLYASLMDLM